MITTVIGILPRVKQHSSHNVASGRGFLDRPKTGMFKNFDIVLDATRTARQHRIPEANVEGLVDCLIAVASRRSFCSSAE